MCILCTVAVQSVCSCCAVYADVYAHVHVQADVLQTTTCDVIVFLDSDAWVQNPAALSRMIARMLDSGRRHKSGAMYQGVIGP